MPENKPIIPNDQPITPKPKHRWFHLTPGKLLVVLLAVEGGLLLSERWFPKGWAVLIAVAAVGIFLLLMLFGFIVSLIFRWRFQFSIRSLLVLAVAVAIPCSWLEMEMIRTRRQKEAIQNVIRLGGYISYDYEPNEFMGVPDRTPPKWMQNLFGSDFFGDVDFVSLYKKKVTDDDMEFVKDLNTLQYLGLAKTKITDSGLEWLAGLKHSRYINLEETRVTDTGVAKLKKALPNCDIHY